jgi:hypothetical protein
LFASFEELVGEDVRNATLEALCVLTLLNDLESRLEVVAPRSPQNLISGHVYALYL